MKVRSKFFRVAVEGDTIDGREITRKDIEEASGTYDPRVYGARVWPEHFRGLIPGGPFDALGDIVAAKAETIKEGTILDGKLGLYVQVDALPSLIALNNTGQKIFHSIELFRNFAKTGKAYLFGLASTDTPASLGTQVMAFGANGGELLTGASHEARLEFTEEGHEDRREGSPTLFQRVKDLLGKNTKQTDQRFSDMEKAIEQVAEFASAIKPGEPVPPEFLAQIDTLQKSQNALANEFKALVDKLNTTPGHGQQERPPATGGDGKVVTDC